jgi:hypothetical protein
MEGLVCDSTVPTKAHPERFPVTKEPLKKQTRGSKLVSGGEASFACPFAKKDPLKYRSCNRYTLNRIRDVKQHLSRSHQPPIHCPRCMCVLGTESERDEHLRGSWCGVQDSIIFEGVTLAQKTQLAQRVPSTMTSEDQWFTIFEILFPDHTPKPRSAYKSVELTSEMEVFQDLIHAEGANIISTAIWSRGIHVASPSNAQCGSPGLLLAAIEDGLQQIIQRWSASMQVTPTDPSTSRVAAAKEASSSQMNQNIETADCLHRSPDPPQNKYQRANIPAESGLPAANQKCHQDEADEVGRLLLESGQEPPSWLDTIVDMHQFGESGQSDAMLHEAWSANQRNLEPMFNGNMEDGSDMWKGYNQGDFFN